MRFHVGFSFRLKTLKKFLFPILIGIATYFGLNFLNLGILQVNAIENYDTYYYINYEEYDVFDTKVDDNLTYNELFNTLNEVNSEYFNLFIDVAFNSDNSIKSFRFTLFPKYMPLDFAMYTRNSNTNLRYSLTYHVTGASWNYYTYVFTDFVSSDILSDTNYTNFYSCFLNQTCSSYSVRANLNGTWLYPNFNIFGVLQENTVNDSSNTFVGFYNYNYNSSYYYFIYSFQGDLIYTNKYGTDDSNYYIKTLKINGTDVNLGDKFITYKDYLDSINSSPDEPVDPIEDNTEHKALFNKIYWFDDKNTEYGVLTSIYELLFLYCITMVFFKIATLLKNKRW